MEFKRQNGDKGMAQTQQSFASSDSAARFPSMYEVFMLADEHTPIEFTIDLLSEFFHKSKQDCLALAIELQRSKQIRCGVFTRDVAETKILDVSEFAQKYSYPIKCIMQKEQQHAIKKS